MRLFSVLISLAIGISLAACAPDKPESKGDDARSSNKPANSDTDGDTSSQDKEESSEGQSSSPLIGTWTSCQELTRASWVKEINKFISEINPETKGIDTGITIYSKDVFNFKESGQGTSVMAELYSDKNCKQKLKENEIEDLKDEAMRLAKEAYDILAENVPVLDPFPREDIETLLNDVSTADPIELDFRYETGKSKNGIFPLDLRLKGEMDVFYTSAKFTKNNKGLEIASFCPINPKDLEEVDQKDIGEIKKFCEAVTGTSKATGLDKKNRATEFINDFKFKLTKQ